MNPPKSAQLACILALACLLFCRPYCLAEEGLKTPKLLATLPDFCPTPDGMAVAPDGQLVVACPNFGDQSKPASRYQSAVSANPRSRSVCASNPVRSRSFSTLHTKPGAVTSR